MTASANFLRTAAAVFFLGTFGAMMTPPAQAAGGVHAAVGNPLKDAEALAAKGDYKAALAKVNQANAAAKTSDEKAIVAKMREYIGVKSGDPSIGGAPAAKVKFAQDVAARRYRQVIADGEMLRKYGALDAQSMQVIAQAYWQSKDPKGCVQYIKKNLGSNASEDALKLQMRCAYDAGDTAAQRDVLETLVSRTNDAAYWSSLLKLSENAGGLSDHQTLDIYRLKFRTTPMTQSDYTLLAQLAIQFGAAGEAVAVLKKGEDAKLLSDARSQRLIKLAQTRAAADAADMSKTLAAAQASHNGDALVKLGEEQWGAGDSKQALANIQAGIKKGVTDKNNAQIRLGLAYLGLGQKAQAQHAFAAVTGDPKWVMIAHMWALYARH
jgi:hypothetical protein